MNHIRILPDNLVNQIAAGEVVERPSSVVKELMENSIDAGATVITVEIEDGGKKLIKVTDNGHGIPKEDLPLVFERHATSKIATEEDLTKISTLGFRGEAIASIGSVAKVMVASRIDTKESGHLIFCESGNLTDPEPFGMPVGTQVTVKHLFYNTPARLKFMKTDQTEFNHITNYVTEVALINPALHAKLIQNGKLVAEYTPSANTLERMRQVFGNTIAKELLPVQYLGSDIKLEGFIGKPGIARLNRFSQYLFVNGRPVKNSTISAAVQKGFHSLLPHGKFPLFVINLQMPFEKVDVNVHPRKLEVRFLYQNELFQIVTAAVKKSLETNTLSPEFSGTGRSYWNTENLYSQREQGEPGHHNGLSIGLTNMRSGSQFSNPGRPGQNAVNAALKFTEEFLDYEHGSFRSDTEDVLSARAHQPISEREMTKPEISLSPICQIANSYILARGAEGLVIIDQHAAHERVLYNYFLKRAEKQLEGKSPKSSDEVTGATDAVVGTQRLLVPVELELPRAEIQLLEQNLDTLSSIGFEIESFGGNTFHVHAVPTTLIKSDIQKVILEVIDDLKNGDPKKLKEPQHAAICYMACRGATKFGDALTHEEMVGLISQMSAQDQKYTCPHGRPTMINLTFAELEKRFGRK